MSKLSTINQEENSKLSNISDRILKFIELKSIKKREFYLKTGLSNGALDKNSNFRVDTVEKIISTYPELNAFWLITGVGEMLNTEIKGNLKGNLIGNPNTNKLGADESKVNYLTNPKADIITVIVDSEGHSVVPILDVQAAAGLPLNYNDPNYYTNFPTIKIPWVQYQSGDYFIIQTTGDSMSPTIYQGDWLFCKRIYDFKEIRDGYIHVIVTKEGVVVKRVLNRIDKRNALALQSDNEIYNTYDLPINEDLLMLFKVEMKWSAILRNENSDMRKDINGLKKDVLHIKDIILDKK